MYFWEMIYRNEIISTTRKYWCIVESSEIYFRRTHESVDFLWTDDLSFVGPDGLHLFQCFRVGLVFKSSSLFHLNSDSVLL